MEAIGEDGSIDVARERPVRELLTGYSYFANGDVLVAKVTPCFENGKGAVLQSLPSTFGFGTSEVTTLRPGHDLDQRFLGYLLRSDRFRQSSIASMTGAGGLKRVPDEHIRSFTIGLPNRSEQKCIASFLDRETAKIDALIAKQHQLIATLREDRAATITHAVTKGSGPDSELVDSGSKWLGSVPKEWEPTGLRHIVETIRSGTSVNCSNTPTNPGEIGVLQTSCVSSGRFDPKFHKTALPEEVDSVSCPVTGGTIIVNRANTPDLVGSSGYVERDIPDLFLSDLLWSVTLMRVNPQFVAAWMQSAVYRTQVAAWRVGTSASMQKISQGSLRSFQIALPPIDEQGAIVDFLDSHCLKIDTLIAKSTEMIATLREYRSALITDAVTGKIDVRGVA